MVYWIFFIRRCSGVVMRNQESAFETVPAPWWFPQDGPQSLAVSCPANLILYGGARGGGKTDCAIGRQILGALRYGYKWNGLFIRKNYKYFKELRRRIKELIMLGLPAELKGGDQQTNTLAFKNGATVSLTAVPRSDMLDFFQGQQFTEVSIEEACQFPFIETMIEMLKGCMRSPHGVPCSMFLTANPGGPGHQAVKVRFVSPFPAGLRQIKADDDMTTVFIPSKVRDNKILCSQDPGYVSNLESIRDPAVRKAWLEGDWDVVAGGFFDDIWRDHLHWIRPFRVPMHWPRLMGFDWGSAKPFSVGWWAVSGGEYISEAGRKFPRGSLIRIREWYGCVRGRSDVGLRLDSTEIAERIREIEKKEGDRLLGSGGKEGIDRIADPAIFKQEDGPSIAEKMAKRGIIFRRGDNKRIPGWDSARQYMKGEVIHTEWGVDRNGNRFIVSEEYEPHLYVFDTCHDFRRTVPSLARDEHDYEDIDTDQEDHIADEFRYITQSRQGKGVSEDELPRRPSPLERDLREIEKYDEDSMGDGLDNYTRPVGLEEHDMIDYTI